MKDISICSYFNFKNKKRISKFRIDLKNMGSACSNCSTKDDEKYQVEVERDSINQRHPRDSDSAKLLI